MNIEQVVRVVEVRGQAQGMDQVARAYDQVASSADRSSKSLGDNGAAAVDVEAALNRLSGQLRDTMRQQQQYTETLAQQSRLLQQSAAANDNYSQSSSRIVSALKAATRASLEYAASWIESAGAVAKWTLIAAGWLGILGGLYAAYRLVATAIGLVTDAWQLSGEKLDQYRQIAEKAAKVDLSTDYFQRITKAAADAKLPVDELTAALKKLQESSTEKLGGSDLQNRLNQHLEAGNFKNSAGVTAFAQANTTQERFEAIADIIRKAMEDGERLAALDLANTAFGPAITERLRTDSEYLDKLRKSAAEVAATQLVSDADIGRALDLQKRYAAAVAILEQRWHPIQELQVAAGIRMREVWVSIVESIAAAVDWVTKLVVKIAEIPGKFWDSIKNGANAVGQFVTDNLTTPESRAASERSLGISSSSADIAATAAENTRAAGIDKLRAAMQNQYAVQQKVNEANTINNKILGDKSNVLDKATKSQVEQNDAVDRAINTLSRHIEQQKADALAVGLGDGALARFRAQAAETAAVQANNGKQTAEQAAKFAQLKIEAEGAADALAKAKVASEIDFAGKTALLSSEDVAIARQLRGIYGNDVTEAINSAYASQIRFNTALRQAGDAERAAFTDFLTNMRQGKTLAESLTAAFGTMADTLSKIGANKLFDLMKSGNAGGLSLNVNTTGTSKQSLDDLELKNRNAASNPGNSFSFNGSNTALAGVAAVGAGIGIYGQSRAQAAAGGSVSSSILSGAISGGLSGAAIGSMIAPGIGTLVGGAVGLVAGAIVGWFGGSSGADDAAKKAQADWAAVRQQASAFADTLAGGAQGSLTTSLTQASTQMKQYIETAEKAGDTAAVKKLQDSYNVFVTRAAQTFMGAFGHVVDALNSGLGPSSPFADAATNVKSIGEQLKGFINDTKLAFSNDPYAVGLGDKDLDKVGGGAAQVAQATKAAQNYLLSLLGQAPVLTDVASAIQHLSGTANQLQSTLVELGMSSSDAAQAIQAGVLSSMQKLAYTFTLGLEREINSAVGQDYLNSAADLVAKRAANLQDAASLGLGSDVVDRWFAASAQKLVNDEQLTGAALEDLEARFPPLQGVVHAFVSGVIDDGDALAKAAAAAAERAQGYQDRLFAATNDSSTYAGAIAAAVRKDLQEQAAEYDAGGEKINELVEAQQQELRVIYWKFTNDAIAAASAAAAVADRQAQDAIEQARAAELAIAQRAQGYDDRLFDATNDNSSYAGAIAAAVRRMLREQAAEIDAGGRNINQLVAAQQAELNGIYWQFTNAAIAAADAAQKAVAARVQSYSDRLFEATNDASTLEGALAAFDRKAAADRLAEAGAGNEALSQLETALMAERYQIVKKFSDASASAQQQAMQQVLDYALRFRDTIKAYLQDLKVGAGSILNPKDRLNAAQSYFTAQAAAANSGDQVARDGLTKAASALLDLAKSFFASSAGYVAVYNNVVSTLGSVAGLPGYAQGGLIGNGIYGVDSVVARYAGGGAIALAGGEYVMPAAQTQDNLAALEAMRAGRLPANDNAALIAEVSTLRSARSDEDNDELIAAVRALQAEVAALRGDTRWGAGHIAGRVDNAAGLQTKASNESRQAGNRPKRYGT